MTLKLSPVEDVKYVYQNMMGEDVKYLASLKTTSPREGYASDPRGIIP